MSQLDFSSSISCYNGAFDSKSSAVFAARDKAMAEIRTKEPEAHVTWHYTSDRAVVHVWGRPISDECFTIGQAIENAHNRLFPVQMGD